MWHLEGMGKMIKCIFKWIGSMETPERVVPAWINTIYMLVLGFDGYQLRSMNIQLSV